jgi:ABC-type ATPase involved in cell division
MVLTINIQDETIAEKIVKILNIFKNDGVEIVEIGRKEDIVDSLNSAIAEVNSGRLDRKEKSLEDLIDEL